jgi:predicted RNA-binding Zn-ribbon protein involved in translation (DUF1610 family)
MKTMLKTTVALLLCIAIVNLNLAFAADKAPPPKEPEGKWVAAACVTLVLVGIAAVGVVAIHKAMKCSEKEKCEECGRILPEDDTVEVCPRCGTPIPEDTTNTTQVVQFAYNPAYGNFETLIQSSSNGITWEDIYWVDNYIYNGGVEIMHFDSWDAFNDWMASENLTANRNVLFTNAMNGAGYFRLIQRDLD